MSDSMSTIAILGATSGIGSGLARRFHSAGKKIIATGRRLERLEELQTSLGSNVSIAQMDVSNISTLPSQLHDLFAKYPDIDTIIANAGVQQLFDYKDPSSSSVEKISNEITTNLTFPSVLAYVAVPWLLQTPEKKGTLIFVSSGLAFAPTMLYPVYCPTKAAMHSFCVSLRAQLHDTNVRVVELAPPKVQTELDRESGGKYRELLGERAMPAMGLEEYLDKAMEGLQGGKEEVGVGFAEMGMAKWREAFGDTLKMMGTRG